MSSELDHHFDNDYNVPLANPIPDFYTPENLYMWHDADGIYQWANAARSDVCSLSYSSPSYYPSPFASELSVHYRYDDLDEPSLAQENSYISHLAQQFRSAVGRPQAQDHRSSIARASDNFLAHASSIFTDGHSSLRRAGSLDYRPSMPHQSVPQHDPRPPSRKRSRDPLDEGSYHVKQEDDHAHPSLPTTSDTCRLPQPHLIVPTHGLSSFPVLAPHHADGPALLNPQSHVRERESRLRPEERCMVQLPKHMSNKRVHRSSEELVRQESTIVSMPTWPSIPDDQVMKAVKKPGEQKKQALACLFCRERKIACGRPPAHSPEQTCNQCARRRIKCEYPTESRRGQHKRRRKPVESEPAGQSALRANSTSTVSSTSAASSTTLATTTPPA